MVMRRTNIVGGENPHLEKGNKISWILLFGLTVLAGICLFHSLGAGHYVDFSPMNGTFQNFNPVRRMLDGQIPYRDFQDYLGMGHLYAGTIFTKLFGGNFQSSLVAFTYLTILCIALIALMIGNAIFQKKEVSILFADMILLLLVIQPLFFKNFLAGMEEILNALNNTLSPGNSARFVRGMILPITYFLFLFGGKGYYVLEGRRSKLAKKRSWIALCGVALAAGFAFAWSNDYGISCWLCLMVMTFFVIFARKRNFIQALAGMVVEALLSLAALFLFVVVFTAGHFQNWFQSVFGTGGYQAWYYNSAKSYYLYDIDFSFLTVMQGMLCIFYLVKLYWKGGSKQAILRYGVLAYMNMVCFCAVNEYKLLSGGLSREVALSVLFLTVLAELCQYGRVLLREHSKWVVSFGICFTGVAWIVSTAAKECIFWSTNEAGTYVEQLGGNISQYAFDLSAASDFLHGEDFFSTYASAQEVVEGKYQPSGMDYIIHVLGDRAREKYLDVFQTGDFKYAATIEENLNQWGYWVKRANWFFYRELYRKWHPVYANSYERYWEQNEEEGQNVWDGGCSVEVVELSHAMKKIVIHADASVNGVADLYVDYKAKKREDGGIKLLFQTMVKAENSGTVYAEQAAWESNYLRTENREHIPVTIVDGYGEMLLTSYPQKDTDMEVLGVSCSEIFTVEFDYVKVENVVDNGNQMVVSVVKNAKMEKALEDVEGIAIGEKQYKISEVHSDEEYLYLVLPTSEIQEGQDREILKDGNIFQVVRF